MTKPKAVLKDGRLVPLQALSPMTPEQWGQAALESQERVSRMCLKKAAYEEGRRMLSLPGPEMETLVMG